MKKAQNLAENDDLIIKNSEIIQGKKRGRRKLDISEADKEIRRKVDIYFNSNEIQDLTFAGLAKVVGCKSAVDFIDLAKKKGGVLGDAFLRMEDKYEKLLISKYSTGAIFGLKQAGWQDTQVVQAEVKSVSVNLSINAGLDDLAKALHPGTEEQHA